MLEFKVAGHESQRRESVGTRTSQNIWSIRRYLGGPQRRGHFRLSGLSLLVIVDASSGMAAWMSPRNASN
jgi:hypothetical protein